MMRVTNEDVKREALRYATEIGASGVEVSISLPNGDVLVFKHDLHYMGIIWEAIQKPLAEDAEAGDRSGFELWRREGLAASQDDLSAEQIEHLLVNSEGLTPEHRSELRQRLDAIGKIRL